MASNKTNTKININPDSFTLSNSATTWNQWLKQKYRHYSTGKYYRPIHKFLLSKYSFSHFLFYPLFVASLLFYNWQFALAVFGIRFLVQAFVLYPCMKKLKEQDLFIGFLFFDIWMFFYYILFAPALFKKPKGTWK
jgi:hypothetical protein